METQRKGILYLIPTGLSAGTGDRSVNPMTRQVLVNTRHYLVENIRTARRWISALELGVDIDGLHFELVDKRTDEAELPAMMQPLLSGTNMGLMSEAGCPAVADPGSRVVARAHRHGIAVRPLVGPSSILLALMGSGFNGQSFVFHGYLPIDEGDRKKKIRAMEESVRKTAQTQIFMETPYRNQQLLGSLLRTCREDTCLCIAANLTAEDEVIGTRSIAGWKTATPALHKVPAMFLLGRD